MTHRSLVRIAGEWEERLPDSLTAFRYSLASGHGLPAATNLKICQTQAEPFWLRQELKVSLCLCVCPSGTNLSKSTSPLSLQMMYQPGTLHWQLVSDLKTLVSRTIKVYLFSGNFLSDCCRSLHFFGRLSKMLYILDKSLEEIFHLSNNQHDCTS